MALLAGHIEQEQINTSEENSEETSEETEENFEETFAEVA